MAKKQPAKVEQKQQSFYVGVANPADVRKTMLEASRELLMSLKQYEHLRMLRTQKSALYAQYHAQVSTIKSLMVKLQKAVPKHDLSGIAQKTAPVVAPTPVVETPKTEEVKEKAPRVSKETLDAMDEVARLEAELAQIEDKLSSM